MREHILWGYDICHKTILSLPPPHTKNYTAVSSAYRNNPEKMVISPKHISYRYNHLNTIQSDLTAHDTSRIAPPRRSNCHWAIISWRSEEHYDPETWNGALRSSLCVRPGSLTMDERPSHFLTGLRAMHKSTGEVSILYVPSQPFPPPPMGIPLSHFISHYVSLPLTPTPL